MKKQKNRKRNIGERAQIYLDSIDYEILNFIKNSGGRGFSVLDLAKILKLNHNTLKPHLDKLIALKLIVLSYDEKNLLLTTPINLSKYAYENLVPDIDFDTKDDEKDVQHFNKYYSVLEDVHYYFRNEKNKSLLDLDLRKTRELKKHIKIKITKKKK